MVSCLKLSVFLLVSFTCFVFFWRYRVSSLPRTNLNGNRIIETSKEKNTNYWNITVRANETNYTYFELIDTVRNGINDPCSTLVEPGDTRVCTPPYHIHLDQTETFSVLFGVMTVKKDDKILKFTPENGKTIEIFPGTKHTFWNGNDKNSRDILRIRAKLKPVFDGEAFFENLGMLMYDDLLDPLQAFLIMCESNTQIVDIPEFVWKNVIVNIVCPFSRLLGYKAYYPEYTTNMPQVLDYNDLIGDYLKLEL